MIKIALKHFIYEKCINVIFNAIKRNFMNAPIPEFSKGGSYKHLVMHSMASNTHLYNCKILDTWDATTPFNTDRKIPSCSCTGYDVNGIYQHVPNWVLTAMEIIE